MTYAITGASGTLGRLTAEAALRHVDPSELVLLTRRPSELADLAERGVEIRRADFSDASSLPQAFAGVDRLLLISTDAIGDRVEGHVAAVDAAVAAGVGYVAYTSMGDPSDSNPVILTPDHRATEDHLRASDVRWTFLRNAIYAEMLLPAAQAALASGTHVTNLGTGATSYVARADCAAVAAAVLTTPGQEGKALDVTGAQALDAEAQAALFAELGGREVTVTHVDDDGWVASMIEHAGMPERLARAYMTFAKAARLGYADAVAPTVQDLTGRSPRTAREVLEAHRSELPVAA